MHPLVNTAINAAREAGKTLTQSFDHLEGITVTEKQANDFVSNVDSVVEEQIIETIRKRHPDHAIMGEESGHHAGDDHCWIIDPLDGTANFIHGIPHFAVYRSGKDVTGKPLTDRFGHIHGRCTLFV